MAFGGSEPNPLRTYGATGIIPRRRKTMRTTAALLLAALASCASIGTTVSDEKVARLRRGMTMTEVRTICGLPQADVSIGNTREWTYVYSYAQSFVFATTGSSRTVKMLFRKDLLDSVPGYDLQPKESVATDAAPK